MTIVCPHCAVSLPDDADYCPACGRATGSAGRAKGMVGGLPETLAGALAYFLLPAILFLLVEPYNKNRFVRFHSFQCLAVCLAGVVFGAILRIVGFLLFFIPVIGHLFVWLMSIVAILGWLILWLVLIVKALQGEIFRLPLAGDFAERQTSDL